MVVGCTPAAAPFGATETCSAWRSGGEELSIGWAVDSTSFTFGHSSPVFCTTPARYSSVTCSLPALSARSLYCGFHDALSTR